MSTRLYGCFISLWSQLSSLHCLNSFRNLSLSVLSPVNTVGGSPASFPFAVGVAVATAVVPLPPDVCPCLEDIPIGAAALVICGAGGLPCLVMKSWIWLVILLVIVACGGSDVNGWVPCNVTMCPVAAAKVASVCTSVLPYWGSCSSGVCASGSLPVLGVAG
jgi:hypothetical protein